MFNAEVKKRFKEMLGKREEAWDRAKKHGVHYFKDIGFAFWNSIEIRQVRPVEDIIKAVVEKS